MKKSRVSHVHKVKVFFYVAPVFVVGLGFVILTLASATRAQQACVPPVTCEEHCSGWPTAEERSSCVHGCNLYELPKEWEDNYQGCLNYQASQQRRSTPAVPVPGTSSLGTDTSANQTPDCARWGNSSCSPDTSNRPTPLPAPLLPASPSPLPSAPAPSLAPAPQIPVFAPTSYVDTKTLKKGDVVTAPSDQAKEIPVTDGKMDLKPGSSVKFLGKDGWQLMSGAVRFLHNHLKRPEPSANMRTRNAVASVRGTEYLMDVAADGTTHLAVIRGSMHVTDAKGKKPVDVKAGFETTVGANGPSRPAPISSAQDTWYANIAPAPSFINASWNQTAAIDHYARSCSIGVSTATSKEVLTTEEQVQVGAFNQAAPQFHIEIEDVLSAKEQKLVSTKSKTNITGSATWKLFVDAKGIYYPSTTPGTWKRYFDKTFIKAIFNMAKSNNIVSSIDRGTLAFNHWEEKDGTRYAAYTAKLTESGTADLIRSVTTQDPEAGQDVASAEILVNEETGLWASYTASVITKSGKIEFPMAGKCDFVYEGNKIKVTIPTKVKAMDAKTGKAELQEYMGSM